MPRKTKQTRTLLNKIVTRFRGDSGCNRYAWTRQDVLKAVEAAYDLGVNSERLLNAIFEPVGGGAAMSGEKQNEPR